MARPERDAPAAAGCSRPALRELDHVVGLRAGAGEVRDRAVSHEVRPPPRHGAGPPGGEGRSTGR